MAQDIHVAFGVGTDDKHIATVDADGVALALSLSVIYEAHATGWVTNSPLNTARAAHTVTLLSNGKVLVAAGSGTGDDLSSAEVYDVGLRFSASWQPQIATVSSPFSLGRSLALTGSQFRGVSGGSGGNTMDSPADYPVVQLRSVESGQTLFLHATSWSTNSFTSAPVWDLPPGYALVTVFVNGIPSPAKIVHLGPVDPGAFRITSLLRQGDDILITWQTFGGKTNYVQASNGGPTGSFTNNFTDVSLEIIPSGTSATTTNYLDVGGATNKPARYYRVRLVP